MSGKHIDGCDHIGGFHDGLYELYNGLEPSTGAKITVPTEADLTTVLEQDNDMAATFSAAQIIRDSQPVVDALNAQLEHAYALDHNAVCGDVKTTKGHADCAGSTLLGPPTALVQACKADAETTTSTDGQSTVAACPGCMYATTAVPFFDDTDTLAESLDKDGCYVQTAGGRWSRSRKWKVGRFTRTKEKVARVVRGCGLVVMSLGRWGGARLRE